MNFWDKWVSHFNIVEERLQKLRHANPDAITLPCYLLGLPDTFRCGLVILEASSINFKLILGIQLQFLPERATSLARKTPFKA